MVGFGNAGRELARILVDRGQDLGDRMGFRLLVTGICTRTRGAVIDPSGLDMRRILAGLQETGALPGWGSTGRGEGSNAGAAEPDTYDFIRECPSDAIVETTPLNIMTAQPATSYIETALRLGKHVVTANKGPVAWHYRRLATLARDMGVRFLFESTVMDGTPIFNMVSHCLAGCSVIGFSGILNSTTNFILDEMKEGASFDAALEKAQRMGIAEADPSLDIDGWDSAAKTAVLMNVLMDARVTPVDIDREGIATVDDAYLRNLGSSGRSLRLVCEGTRSAGRVRIAEIEAGHSFAGIAGTSSILSLQTDLMGEITLIESHPTVTQTAYGLLNDIIEVATGSPSH